MINFARPKNFRSGEKNFLFLCNLFEALATYRVKEL